MKVLIDHNLPRQLKHLPAPHEVFTARELRWDVLKNGDLIAAAEEDGFGVPVTGDQNLAYQQNQLKRSIALIVVSETSRRLLIGQPELFLAAIERCTMGSFEVVVIPKEAKVRPAVE